MKLKDEIKVKWLGSSVILKLERSRGYDSPDADVYAGDCLLFWYDVNCKKWRGNFSYEIRDKHNFGGFISVNDGAKSPQLLANKLRRNLDKLFEMFGLEL